MSFIDYETSSEEYWRIDEWSKLAERFSLEEPHAAAWHDFMAGQGRAWEIARHLYGIYPLLGSTELVRRGKKELAEDLGVSQVVIEREMEAAAEAWSLARARESVSSQLRSQKGDIETLTRFSHADGLDEQAVDELLKAFDFDSVRDPEQRVRVAGRILTLSEHLRAPNTRVPAREVIRMEITMHALQKMQIAKQDDIDQILDNPERARMKGHEIDKMQDRVNLLDDRIRKIAKDHSDLLERIGADELDLTARKKQFVADMNYLIEACRDYESDPANMKVDGIWTAEEIDWQLDPLAAGRDAQYRPDIAIRMGDALRPENLWDPTYRPPKVAKRVCQELARIVRHLRGIPEDAAELPEDPETLAEMDDEATTEGDAPTDSPAPSSHRAFATARSSRIEADDEEPTMGVFET